MSEVSKAMVVVALTAFAYAVCGLLQVWVAAPHANLMTDGVQGSYSSGSPTMTRKPNREMTVSPQTHSSRMTNNAFMSMYNPWATLGMREPPPDGIISDPNLFIRLYEQALSHAHQRGADSHEIRALVHAKQACIFYHSFRKMAAKLDAIDSMPTTGGATSVARDDVQRVLQQLKDTQDALESQSAQFEKQNEAQASYYRQQQEDLNSWGRDLRAEAQRRIAELTQRLVEAEEAASCAPAWFRQLKTFETERCSKGDTCRVASTDLHEAFVDYLERHHREIAAPSHKEFRELMENQGYQYDQLYIDGTNKRGFRGIGLKRQA